MKRVGVIGAGLMGTVVTKRLLAAGSKLLAYDVDATKREAIGAPAAKGSVNRQPVVIAGARSTCSAVFDTDQVEDVIAGPGRSGRHAPRGRRRGAHVCREPARAIPIVRRHWPRASLSRAPTCSKCRSPARAGRSRKVTASAWSVATAKVARRAAEVLDAICARRHYIGDVGHGSRAKLAVNMILGLKPCRARRRARLRDAPRARPVACFLALRAARRRIRR